MGKGSRQRPTVVERITLMNNWNKTFGRGTDSTSEQGPTGNRSDLGSTPSASTENTKEKDGPAR